LFRLAQRRAHRLVAAAVFTVLGFHVGVYSVQLAALSAALRLSPGTLGAALTAASAAGTVTLVAGGRLSDRLGRRPVLLLGFAGTALAFALLSQVRSVPALVAVLLGYGLCCSFIDLSANALGADHERAYGVPVMTGLHAGFSLGATLGALSSALLLWSGTDWRTVYLALAVVLALTALAATIAPLPPHSDPPVHQATPAPPVHQGPVWRIPGVAFAVAVTVVTFFGDGALESFLAVYLRRALDSGVLLSGVGIGGYHLAMLAGRLLMARLLPRWGERRVVVGAGLLACAGISIAVAGGSVGGAIAGLLLVGFAIAPVVPSALSLAGRSAPRRAASAVATATAAGYGAFVVSPVLIGALADATSLRTGLAVLIATTLAIAALGRRWPVSRR
jgi:MFS family permease